MKLYFVVTKKGLCVFILVLIMVLGVLIKTRSAVIPYKDGSTHAKRVEYLKDLRLEVDENDFSSKETVIPADFDELYKKYNAIQRKAGFDLNFYKGKGVALYTYKTETHKQVSLLVCEGKIIGGDVSEISYGGEMTPLIKQ